jgi:hypothetical protein
MGVKCLICGADIRYIPVGFSRSITGNLIVESDYIEIVTDSGRVVKGHILHTCLGKEAPAQA